MKRSTQLTLIAGALLFSSGAWAHDGAASCKSDVAKQPAFEKARAEVRQKPRSVGTRTDLADALLEIGCYDEAVHLLEDGVKLLPNDRNLQTRLKTAKSYVEEREHQDNNASAPVVASEAVFLRYQLRCKQIGDPAACDQAIGIKPTDVSLFTAKGDALLKERRPKEALLAFNRAKQLAGTDAEFSSRINAAQAMLAAESPPAIAQKAPAAPTPVRTAAVAPSPRYSNIEPASRSN